MEREIRKKREKQKIYKTKANSTGKQIIPWKIYSVGFGKGFLKGGILGLLFYRHILAILLMGCILGIYACREEKRRVWSGRQQEITLQFREGLQGISSSLSAGYAIENAFEEARKDLILLYGENSILEQEFLGITKQLRLNRPIEQVLYEFAEKWDTEDIRHFSQVFRTAKRTGGDLIAITHATSEKISQKIEIQREIQTMLAGKKMEGRIMSVIPLGLILYFWVSSPGFLDCFYLSAGRIVSTILLLVYLAAYRWSERICDIQV